MAKQKWAIRIVLDNENRQDQKMLDTPWIECLRYAGLVRVHRDDNSGMCIDIVNRNPQIDTQVWAQMNAKRMESFGINAVAAPEAPLGL